MIAAKDLRVSNWVKREFYNPHPTNPQTLLDKCEVFIIKPDTVHLKLKGGSIIKNYPLSDLHPIVLSPEILEKSGFYKTEVIRTEHKQFDFNTITENYEIGDWLEPPFFEISVTTNTKDNTVAINSKHKSGIKYLHELQNLFHAITGEELIVNL